MRQGRCYPDRRPAPQRGGQRPTPIPGPRPFHATEARLRKYALAALAAPVILVIYLGALLRASGLARAGVALGLGGIIGLGAIAIVRPTATTATAPTDVVPLTQAAFRTVIATGFGVDDPATIEFSSAMDRASVEAALDVQPSTPVQLVWAPDSASVSVVPSDHWAPGTYHTITVQAGALAINGRPLTVPARASFLTREPSQAVVAPTVPMGSLVAADTGFSVAFSQPVEASTLANAIRLDPPVEGTVSVASTIDGMTRLVFTPVEPLAGGTTYELLVDGVRDEDGLTVAPARLAVDTVNAPSVVRFRPAHRSNKVDRDQTLSVRFSKAMDRGSTKRALTVTADGKAVDGKVSWAEGDTVLIFDPVKRLPYDAKIVATVAPSARSKDGARLAEAGRAYFLTAPKPKPAPRASSSGSSGGSSGGSGGGSVGGGSWAAVERYYLGLMNCTRTGGWVDSGGHCDSPGGRDVAPLKLSAGISSKVARPYAKLLAVRGACDHFLDGNPGNRLKRAGYTNWTWAENIGCPSGDPYNGMIRVQRFFQSEKSYNGGHWVNMMNPKYSHVGIGVWVKSGRVRVVIDFYHP